MSSARKLDKSPVTELGQRCDDLDVLNPQLSYDIKLARCVQSRGYAALSVVRCVGVKFRNA